MELFGGVHYSDGPDPDNITRMDTNCLPMIHDFHRHGIRLDVPFLHSLNDKIRSIQEEIEVETNIYIDGYQYRNPTKGSLEPFKIGSRDHLAQLLFEHLKIQGDSPVPFTPSGKRFEVSEEIMEPFKEAHPIVPGLIEWHKVEKLRNTYAATLPYMVDSDSRLHTQFNATVAATGRLSSSNPNLQNIPIRSTLGKEIRKAFTCPPGWDLVSCDLSQIEMVWAAHRSQDPTMLSVFNLGQDIHDRTTCNVFGYDYYEVQALKKLVKSGNATPEQVAEFRDYTQFKRLPCKTVGFGVLYGQTAEGLQKSLASEGVFWTLVQCEDFIVNKFFSVYPELKTMLERDYRFAKRYAMICCEFGRVRLVPEAKSQIRRIMNEGIRKAGNHPEQCVNPNTTVFVKGEGLRHLGDLVGTKKTLWDGSKWAAGKVVAAGKKKQLRITLFNKQELYCSPDHKILVFGTKGKSSWKTAEELAKSTGTRKNRNFRAVISSAIPEEWNWNEFPPTCDIQPGDKNLPVDLTWCEEFPDTFGEMLGRIASDGGVLCSSVSRKFSPKVTYMLVAEHEKAILTQLQYAASLVSDKLRTITTQREGYAPMYRVEVYSRGFAELLLQWQIKYRIPQFVWNNSQILKAYLRGYFDGDGCVTPDGTLLTFGGGYSKIALAKDIQQALLVLGIRSRLRSYPKAIRLRVQKKDFKLFNRIIGFINPKKMLLASEVGPSKRSDKPSFGRAISIDKIEDAGECEMVDFVDSSTGRFCADGFVVHNSSAQGTIKIAMARILPLCRKLGEHIVKPLLQIHDELIFQVVKSFSIEFAELCRAEMEAATPLSIPVRSSSDIAERWGDFK